MNDVVIDVEATRMLNSGLGQFALHLGRAILAEPHDDLHPILLLRAKNRSLFPDSATVIEARRWLKDRFVRRVRPLVELAFRPPRYRLWHCTHQFCRYLPMSSQVPGSTSANATEMYHEGLLVPPRDAGAIGEIGQRGLEAGVGADHEELAAAAAMWSEIFALPQLPEEKRREPAARRRRRNVIAKRRPRFLVRRRAGDTARELSIHHGEREIIARNAVLNRVGGLVTSRRPRTGSAGKIPVSCRTCSRSFSECR